MATESDSEMGLPPIYIGTMQCTASSYLHPPFSSEPGGTVEDTAQISLTVRLKEHYSNGLLCIFNMN